MCILTHLLIYCDLKRHCVTILPFTRWLEKYRLLRNAALNTVQCL